MKKEGTPTRVSALTRKSRTQCKQQESSPHLSHYRASTVAASSYGNWGTRMEEGCSELVDVLWDREVPGIAVVCTCQPPTRENTLELTTLCTQHCPVISLSWEATHRQGKCNLYGQGSGMGSSNRISRWFITSNQEWNNTLIIPLPTVIILHSIQHGLLHISNMQIYSCAASLWLTHSIPFLNQLLDSYVSTRTILSFY